MKVDAQDSDKRSSELQQPRSSTLVWRALNLEAAAASFAARLISMAAVAARSAWGCTPHGDALHMGMRSAWGCASHGDALHMRIRFGRVVSFQPPRRRPSSCTHSVRGWTSLG